jgi:hypothetical protein
MHQLRPCAQGGWHERPTIVLVVDDGVGNIPVLQWLVQLRSIAVGIDRQHEQLADLLRLRQMINIRVDALHQAESRGG